MGFSKEYNDGHEHDFSQMRQLTIMDKKKRILAFEKFCFFCGLVENPVPIGSEVK